MAIDKVSKDGVSNMAQIDGARVLAKKAERNFTDQLSKVRQDMAHEEMDSLLKDIDKQGKILGETLNIKDLRKYKKLVKQFMDYSVKNSFDLKEQSGFDRRGRHKVYTIIETVNNSLANLTEKVLGDQKDNLDILAKIGEIRGMLVDLYS